MLPGTNGKISIVRLLAIAFAISLLMASSVARALGLGDIEILSDLNQPLNAQIRLTLTRPGEADGMEVFLASPQVFTQSGIDRSNAVTDLQFSVDLASSEPAIKITGTEALVNPILTFLLEVEWPTGRMIREYTVLMDPTAVTPRAADGVDNPDSTSVSENNNALTEGPESIERLADQQNTDININGDVATAASADNVNNAGSANNAGNANNVVESDIASLESSSPDEAVAKVRREITVEPGDTISAIADENAIPGVSTQQMMMALLNTNTEAFIDGNVNLVKVGAILRIPDQSDVIQLTQAQAIGQLDEQNQLWREYRDNLRNAAGTRVENTPTNATDEPADEPQPLLSDSARSVLDTAQSEVRRTTELSIVAQSETVSAGASATADDSEVSNAALLGEINSKLQLANEELASNRLEKIDLIEQSDELNSTVENMQALINIRQNEIARLQDKLALASVEQLVSDNDATGSESIAVLNSETSNQASDTQAAGTTANDALASVELVDDSALVDSVVEPLAAPSEPQVAPTEQQSPWYANSLREIGNWVFAVIGLLSLFCIAILLFKLNTRRQRRIENLSNDTIINQPSNADTAYMPEVDDVAMVTGNSTSVAAGVSEYASWSNEEYTVPLDVNLDTIDEETAAYADVDHNGLTAEVDEYLEACLDDDLYDIEEELLGEETPQQKVYESYQIRSAQKNLAQASGVAYSESQFANVSAAHYGNTLLLQDSPLSPEPAELTFDEPAGDVVEFSNATEFELNDEKLNAGTASPEYHSVIKNGLDESSADIYKSDAMSSAEHTVRDQAFSDNSEALKSESLWTQLSTDRDSEVLSANSKVSTEPNLQYKIISALFLGWCVLAWMPEVTLLSSLDIGLAQVCMLAIILCCWKVQQFGSIDSSASRVRLLVCVSTALVIAWAYLGQFGIADSLLSDRIILSLFQGFVVLYVVTTVLKKDAVHRCIQVCALMAVFSVLLCLVARYNVPLERTIFHGTNKASALFAHANQFGVVLAMGIPVVALLVLTGRNTLINLALFFTLAWGLVMSGSNTNIVVAVAVLLLVALYAIAISRHRIVLSLAVAGFLVYAFISGFSLLEFVNYRVAGIVQDFLTYGGENAETVTQRSLLWEHSLNVMANSPFFGEGPGHRFIANDELTNHSHNVILDFGRTIGLPGALGVLVLLIASLILSVKTILLLKQKPPTMSSIILAGACFSIVSYLLSNQLNDSFGPTSSFFFWLSLGLVLRRHEVVDVKDAPVKSFSSMLNTARAFRLSSTPLNSILDFKQALRKSS